MSLVHCPECNHQISDKAPACMKCGNPMKKRAVVKEVSSPSHQRSKRQKPILTQEKPDELNRRSHRTGQAKKQEVILIPKARSQYIHSLVNPRSGIISFAKWSTIAIFSSIILGGMVSKVITGFGGLIFLGVVAACIYGRYREWKDEKNKRKELVELDDYELQLKYDNFITAGGRPRSKGVTPAAWAGLAILVGSPVVYFTYIINSPTVQVHVELDKKWILWTSFTKQENKNKPELIAKMRQLNQFVQKLDVSKTSGKYQSEYATFKQQFQLLTGVVESSGSKGGFLGYLKGIGNKYIHGALSNGKLPPIPDRDKPLGSTVELYNHIVESIKSSEEAESLILQEVNASYGRLHEIARNRLGIYD
jgi:hypothetical protein